MLFLIKLECPLFYRFWPNLVWPAVKENGLQVERPGLLSLHVWSADAVVDAAIIVAQNGQFLDLIRPKTVYYFDVSGLKKYVFTVFSVVDV